MRTVYGIEMQVHAGKLPGFYAQVIHKIGDHVNVFDRDGQLFIVEDENDRDSLAAILAKSSMLGETFPLLLLPPSAHVTNLEDAGFVSQNDHVYLYADRVALFRVAEENTADERDCWAAQEQWKEHLKGEIPATDTKPAIFIIDSHLIDLVEGIGRAYSVTLTWLHRG